MRGCQADVKRELEMEGTGLDFDMPATASQMLRASKIKSCLVKTDLVHLCPVSLCCAAFNRAEQVA